MMIPKVCMRATIAAISCALLTAPSYGIDLSGLWASNGSVCTKVFAKDGNRVSFRKDSHIYGGGFIIDGNSIRDEIANCEITSKKEEGNLIHMIAACGSDILLRNIQVSLRVINDNQITRTFPGMPDITNNYVRCSL